MTKKQPSDKKAQNAPKNKTAAHENKKLATSKKAVKKDTETVVQKKKSVDSGKTKAPVKKENKIASTQPQKTNGAKVDKKVPTSKKSTHGTTSQSTKKVVKKSATAQGKAATKSAETKQAPNVKKEKVAVKKTTTAATEREKTTASKKQTSSKKTQTVKTATNQKKSPATKQVKKTKVDTKNTTIKSTAKTPQKKKPVVKKPNNTTSTKPKTETISPTTKRVSAIKEIEQKVTQQAKIDKDEPTVQNKTKQTTAKQKVIKPAEKKIPAKKTIQQKKAKPVLKLPVKPNEQADKQKTDEIKQTNKQKLLAFFSMATVYRFFDYLKKQYQKCLNKSKAIWQKVKAIKLQDFAWQNIKPKLQNAWLITKKWFTTASKKDWQYRLNVAYETGKKLAGAAVIAAFLIGALGFGIGIGYFASMVEGKEPPSHEKMIDDLNNTEEASKFYFANNQALSLMRSDLQRTSVPIKDMSKNVINALLATEDEDFYHHHGIMPKALVRAVISDVTGLGTSTGGSTLTQQLVKQQLLNNDPTFKRKANEILLSLRVEKHFSKNEILEAYLNVSTFGRNNKGQNIAGVEEAAQGLFGVSAKELSLPQAAFIAGLPQSPSLYTPYTQEGVLKKDLSDGLERKNTVLFRMFREDFISKKAYEKAKKYDLKKDFIKTDTVKESQYGYVYNLIDREANKIIMEKLYKKDGVTAKQIEDNDNLYNKYHKMAEREMLTHAYQIHSTIDKDVYNTMKKVVDQDAASLGQTYKSRVLDEESGKMIDVEEPVQAGGVLMDNQTGRVISFIGGLDFNKGQVDHSFVMKRSPGSTIKPILVYGPAIDGGLIHSETALADTKFEEKDYAPTDYGHQIGDSFVTSREALARSLNLPTVNLYKQVRNSLNPKSYMEKMGIKSISDQKYGELQLSLGGASVTVLEQTSAFTTLANKGTHVDPYVIDKITDKKGNVIYQHEKQETQVFSPGAAYITTDMMRSAVRNGTGAGVNGYLNFSADLAGKTGTSQDFTDIWFIGSTPAVTMSTWIGYDNQYSKHSLENGAYGNTSTRNLRLWGHIASAIHDIKPDLWGTDQTFTKPASVKSASVLKLTGTLPGEVTLEDGDKVNVDGDKVTALYLFSPPKALSYHFGIGGNAEDYAKFWENYLKKVKEKKDKDKKKDEEKDKDKDKEKEEKEKAEKEKKEKEEKDKDKNSPSDDDPGSSGGISQPGTSTGNSISVTDPISPNFPPINR